MGLFGVNRPLLLDVLETLEVVALAFRVGGVALAGVLLKGFVVRTSAETMPSPKRTKIE